MINGKEGPRRMPGAFGVLLGFENEGAAEQALSFASLGAFGFGANIGYTGTKERADMQEADDDDVARHSNAA